MPYHYWVFAGLNDVEISRKSAYLWSLISQPVSLQNFFLPHAEFRLYSIKSWQFHFSEVDSDKYCYFSRADI